MKRRIIYIIFFLIVVFLPNMSEASNIYIPNMDIQITVMDDGKIELNQVIEYKNNVRDQELEVPIGFINEGKPENLEIYEMNSNKKYLEINNDSKPKEGTYKIEIHENEFTTKAFLKIYLKTSDTAGKIKIKYLLKGRCINFENIGEFRYTFDKFETDIGKLTTTINFPNNDINKDLIVESDYMGPNNVINNKVVKFVKENVKKGNYGRITILYDVNNTKDNTKKNPYNYAQKTIDEYYLKKEQKNIELQKELSKKELIQNLEKYGTIAIFILILYWIILLYKYEYDKKYKISILNEDKLFEKFNPLLAGCIVGNRTAISRDIIAVILNLVNKNIINIDIRNVLNKNESYEYILTKNEKNKTNIDEIEYYVYNWVFEEKTQVNLTERLKEITKDSNARFKFEELYDISLNRMNEMGANKNNVPKLLQKFNDILLTMSILYVLVTVIYTIDIKSFTQVIMEVMMVGLIIVPVWIKFSKIITVKLKKICDRLLLGKPKWINTTIVIPIMIFVILTLILGSIISIMLITSRDITIGTILKYSTLITICAIISFTDGLMLKNDNKMVQYYSQLCALKEKINNSLLEDKDVEYIELWDKYLTYAISFGTTKKIQKRIKYIDLDNDLLNM